MSGSKPGQRSPVPARKAYEATLHTIREHVPVEMLVEGMLGYVALALEMGKEES